jgi:DNA topoisomerase II
MNGFLREFVTPILKATKGNSVIPFFTIPEYEAWNKAEERRGWKIKYYKGLGTSTAKEAKEYFNEIVNHTIDFSHED